MASACSEPPEPVEVSEAVDIPIEFGTNLKQFYSNVLGELTLRLILERFLDRDEAETASAGWDGDRVQMFVSSQGKKVLRMESVWDSEQDTIEFFEAYKRLIPEKFNGIREPDKDAEESLLTWKTDGKNIMIRQSNNRVVILESIGDEQTN